MCPDCGQILARDMQTADARKSIKEAVKGGVLCRFHVGARELTRVADFDDVRRAVRASNASCVVAWLDLALLGERVSSKDLGRWLRALGWAWELPVAATQRARKLAGLMVRDDERTKLLTAWSLNA